MNDQVKVCVCMQTYAHTFQLYDFKVLKGLLSKKKYWPAVVMHAVQALFPQQSLAGFLVKDYWCSGAVKWCSLLKVFIF